MSIEIRENELLKNHSTFKIGGPAKYFVVVKSKEELIEAIEFAQNKNLKYFVIGGGSNILFSDEGFDRVIIKLSTTSLQFSENRIIVSSGTPFAQVIMKSVEAGFTGLEWGIGIPGTIGGAVVGNAGAYGHSISENISKVVVFSSGQIIEYSKDECNFNYRESRFKRSLTSQEEAKLHEEIILEVELELEKGDKEKSMEIIKEIISKRAGRIPPYPSIGSIFKNLPAGKAGPKPLITRELIEQCGLKGKQIGGAKIADEHANFIVNVSDAKATDVLELIELCKKTVKEKFNVDLEEEIIVLE